MAEIYLNDIAHGRSGDKGDTSNVCVFARDPKDYEFLKRVLTVERVKEYFGDMVKGEITRYDASVTFQHPLRCTQPERLQLCYEARSGRRCHHEPASGQPGQIHGQCRDAHEDPR